MANWFDQPIPAYLDADYSDGMEPQMVGGASQASTDQVLRLAAIIIVIALAALWAMGYFFKKG